MRVECALQPFNSETQFDTSHLKWIFTNSHQNNNDTRSRLNNLYDAEQSILKGISLLVH